MKKLLFSLVIFSVACSETNAQSSFRGWGASFNSFAINDKWSVLTDIQFRSSSEWEKLQTMIIRPAINYSFNKKLTAAFGYAYTDERAAIGAVSEMISNHRLWEQVQYKMSLNNIDITHRLRLEQRFLPDPILQGGKIESRQTLQAHRLRYFIRNIIPLKRGSSFTKGLFLAGQNEVFLNIGNKRNVNGKLFDQNRLYTAVGYRLNKRLDIDAGYLYQYVSGKGAAKSNNHILQLATYLKL